MNELISRDQYFSYARKEYGVRRESRLRHQMGFLYDGIDFNNKKVLDIGGGAGEHTFYAVASGASSVLTIEPEADGGHDHMHSTFENWRLGLGAVNAKLINTTIQDFAWGDDLFDVVLIQDAINHFDESACMDLHLSGDSRKKYARIFHSISNLITPGGVLIMSDCSSKNLFPLLGLSNPFDTAIEWNKHQPPEMWMELANKAGLQTNSLDWSSPARFGALGKLLFGNSVAAFLFTSHFLIKMKKM